MAEGAQIRKSVQNRRLRNNFCCSTNFLYIALEYISIGLSMPSENLYQISLCMPKLLDQCYGYDTKIRWLKNDSAR